MVFEEGFNDHQIEQLEILLKKSTKAFITMHQPPPIAPFLFHSFHRNSSKFLNLMKNYKDAVEYVFCGHIHGYAETVYDDNIYIVTGGAGSNLDEKQEDVTDKHNYVLIEVDGKIINKKVFFPAI